MSSVRIRASCISLCDTHVLTHVSTLCTTRRRALPFLDGIEFIIFKYINPFLLAPIPYVPMLTLLIRWLADMTKDLDSSQSDAWLSARGFWATYLLCILAGHLVLLSIPVISTETAWTLTNVLHAIVCVEREHFCVDVVLATLFDIVAFHIA